LVWITNQCFVAESEDAGFVAESEDAFRQRTPATHSGNAFRQRISCFCNASSLAETLSIMRLHLSAYTVRLHNVLLPKAKTLVLLPKARTHFGNALRQRTPATHFGNAFHVSAMRHRLQKHSV
jgi:hypothetical protein